MNTEGAEISSLAEAVIQRQARGLGRAMRLVDDGGPRAKALLRALAGQRSGSLLVGITGPAGAGKSTLVSQLIHAYRSRGCRVGVLAVDPTSPRGGGAFLGDRIRMQEHFLDPDVFIHSVAARGQLGGLSRSVADLARVLDAGGFDVILVETLGVGQDELEICCIADTTVLVLAPGLGDEVQALKAGLLEVADVLVVNKADRPGAEATVQTLEQAVALGAGQSRSKAWGHGPQLPPSPSESDRKAPDASEGWTPAVLRTVALRGEGISSLMEACERHVAYAKTTPAVAYWKASLRLRTLFRSAAADEAERRVGDRWHDALKRVRAGGDPHELADELLIQAFTSKGTP